MATKKHSEAKAPVEPAAETEAKGQDQPEAKAPVDLTLPAMLKAKKEIEARIAAGKKAE